MVPWFKSLQHFCRTRRQWQKRLDALEYMVHAERDDAAQRLLRHVFAFKNPKMCCFDIKKQHDAHLRASREVPREASQATPISRGTAKPATEAGRQSPGEERPQAEGAEKAARPEIRAPTCVRKEARPGPGV